MSDIITAAATVTYRSDLVGGVADRTAILLTYGAHRPYEVSLTFPDQPHPKEGRPLVWTFARDLLAAGLVEFTGAADVKVWPGKPYALGSRYVHIGLRSPDGTCVLDVPALMVRRFVAQSYVLVPAGTEAVDVDRALDAILGGAR